MNDLEIHCHPSHPEPFREFESDTTRLAAGLSQDLRHQRHSGDRLQKGADHGRSMAILAGAAGVFGGIGRLWPRQGGEGQLVAECRNSENIV
ncbi:MAG: hypothetical protein JNM13_07470 [Hyphomicrobiaceae bacterium]|nr:hypothetical protein [Hyphomicrobiaceae bacterium]